MFKATSKMKNKRQLLHKHPTCYTLYYSIPPTFYQNHIKDCQRFPKQISRIFQVLKIKQ